MGINNADNTKINWIKSIPIKKIVEVFIAIMGVSIFLYNTWWCLFISNEPGLKLFLWWLVWSTLNIILAIIPAVYLLFDV
jgi:hypothetical protein